MKHSFLMWAGAAHLNSFNRRGSPSAINHMHKASKGGARAETALPADKKAPRLAAGGCAKPSNGDPGTPTDGSPLVPLQNHSHEIGSGVAE
jgi:hypothetical protein